MREGSARIGAILAAAMGTMTRGFGLSDEDAKVFRPTKIKATNRAYVYGGAVVAYTPAPNGKPVSGVAASKRAAKKRKAMKARSKK